MQHHPHVGPMPATHLCTHAVLPTAATGLSGPPPQPLPRMNDNATTTNQHNRLTPYEPQQTSIQMQKIRQQHQHINYKNNNFNSHNNNNNNHHNNNNHYINKNGNYNSYTQNNPIIQKSQQNSSTQQPKQILTRNVGTSQPHQHQAPSASTHQHHMGHIKNHQVVDHHVQHNHNNNNNNLHNPTPILVSLGYNPFHNKMKYSSPQNNNKYDGNNSHKNYGGHGAYNKSTSQNSTRFVEKSACNALQKSSEEEKMEQQPTNSSNSGESSSSHSDYISTEAVGKDIDDGNTTAHQYSENNEDNGECSIEGDAANTTKLDEQSTCENDDSSSYNKTKEINNNNNILSNEDETVSKHGKYKTPMCLVNELARFNKITHQYRLTSEKGPAHCKRFTVTLKLGNEEYSAEGFKIKKAQHLAAAQAIEQTKYKHPLPKTLRRNEEGTNNRSNITPTVALNALAMKLGQQTYYLYDPRQMQIPTPPSIHGSVPDVGTDATISTANGLHPTHFGGPHSAVMPHPQAYMRRSGYPPAFMSPFQPCYGAAGGRGTYMPKYAPHFQPPPPLPPHNVTGSVPMAAHPNNYHSPIYAAGLIGGMPNCKITLIVGKQKFVGIGRTFQQAKHDAAAQALKVLQDQQANLEEEAHNNSGDESDDKKSPISLVHEIGIKRDMMVRFKVLREEGPAHMRKFITACTVGEIITEGEGNGKKISKKRAAEKMLEELKKLPPITPTKSPTRRIKVKTPGKITLGTAATATPRNDRRKRMNMKDKSADTSLNEEENPVTKLLQLQQLNKAKEPIFELIAKNDWDNSRRKEFIVEVTFQSMVARGVANNKKTAKKNAAQNMLDLLNEVKMTETEETINVIIPEKCNNVEEKSTGSTEKSEHIIAASTKSDNEATVEKITTKFTTDSYNLPIVDTTAGQVPGILILRPNKKNNLKKKSTIHSSEEHTSSTTSTSIDNVTKCKNTTSTENVLNCTTTTNSDDLGILSTETTSIAVRNSTKVDTSKTESETSNKNISSNSIMKEQLLYLSKLMGFEVDFSDYPKGGSHSDFLTIVTLSTDPPQICHGTGNSCEESQNDAARSALKMLSELGLNSSKK